MGPKGDKGEPGGDGLAIIMRQRVMDLGRRLAFLEHSLLRLSAIAVVMVAETLFRKC